MITSGLQDYLELIYNSISNNEQIKAIDIANQFNISRSSVSEALIRLADKDLIIYEGRKGIKITALGIEEAKKITNKHQILNNFFFKVLGIDKEISCENACKIEHVIDENVVEKIKQFSEFCLDNSLEKKFKENNVK